MENLFYIFTNWNIASIALIMLVVAYGVILALQVTKNKHVLPVALGIGLLIGTFYLIITSTLEHGVIDNELAVASINGWLAMAWNIFMILLLVILPIYLFTMIATTFTNSRHHPGGRRLLITSFLTLWGMSLLGILVAIAFFPLMLLMKDAMQLTNIPAEATAGALAWYGVIVAIAIILAIVTAVVLNLLHKHKHDSGEGLITFFEKVRDAIKHYLHYVSLMVPYVISGMLVLLFSNYEGSFILTLESLTIFTLIFFAGLIIVWMIEYAIVMSTRDKEKHPKKEFNNITKEYALNDFSVQSSPVLFPITVKYIDDMGLHPDVKETTPIFSTFMGYSMCGGFYPALVVLFTLIQPDPFINGAINDMLVTNWWIMLIAISLMVPLILLMTLGMTGVPGADVAIIIGLLSALGLNPAYFYTVYLIEPLLDKFRGIGNSMGFAAASGITDKSYKKYLDKKDK